MSGSFESVRWNACVHRLDLSLNSHPKEFWGNGVRTHANSKGKIPSTRKILLRGPNLRRCIKQDSEPNTLPKSYSAPHDYSVCLFVGCLTSQQHASVSQGRICSDNFTCCHTEIEIADHTFYLTQSQYTDTRPTSPSADPIMPGAWQGSHWSANFWVTGMTRPKKNPGASGIQTQDLPISRWTPYH